MKRIITLALCLLYAGSCFAAGGVRVNGDFTLLKDVADPYRVMYFSDGSSQWFASPWSYNGSNIYYNPLIPGNIGIGTSSPAVPLDVVGDVNVLGSITASGLINGPLKVQNSSSPVVPATPETAGRIYFDTATKTLNVSDGTSWKVISTDTSPRVNRLIVSAIVSPAASLNMNILGNNATDYSVTAWRNVGSNSWENVTGNTTYPISATSNTITVINKSVSTQDIKLVAIGY